jgi:4-hydroxy-tetrahydrodipicolinate synthase
MQPANWSGYGPPFSNDRGTAAFHSNGSYRERILTDNSLRGIIAAIPTPVSAEGEPDTQRLICFARHLLDNGCDGLNICGTTGEATSMSVAQRKSIMATAAVSLPRERLMVGTGAASLADVVDLTGYACELGFAGALVLPPFYYKSVSDDGLLAYFETLAQQTAKGSIPWYLYHFPALSCVPFHPAIVSRLRERLGPRLRGLKDSSGDAAYARQLASQEPDFDVFPSTEAMIPEVRAGTFAGCISATVNLSSALCAAAYRNGDDQALQIAIYVRKVLSAGPLVPRVKAAVSRVMKDPAFATVLPPHTPLSNDATSQLGAALVSILPE